VGRLERVEKRGRIEWVQPKGTHFITVDLDVYSKVRLGSLVTAFGDNMFVLHEGRWGGRYLASFELGNSWQLSADQEIRRLVALVRSLPPPARRLWNQAQSRVFDIGMQAGVTPHSHKLTLSQDTIEAIASVRGRLTITTYAPEGQPVVGASPAKARRRPTKPGGGRCSVAPYREVAPLKRRR
jgi:hypothetical protein